MEDKRIVICPTSDASIVVFEEVSTVRGEINLNDLANKKSELAILESEISEAKARVEVLTTEIEFAEKILEAKKLKDEADVEEAKMKAAQEKQPEIEPLF